MKRKLHKNVKLGVIAAAAVLLVSAPITAIAESDIDIKEQTEDISSDEAFVATPTNAKKESTEQDEALAAELIGRWDTDGGIGLKLGEKGKGRLILSKKESYVFSYEVGSDSISMDFISDRVMDCEYSLSVSGDKLTLTGGKGTTGESFELTRSE